MIFTINNYVEIKLTQYGQDILKEKEDKIFAEYPSLKEYLYKYKVNNTRNSNNRQPHTHTTKIGRAHV